MILLYNCIFACVILGLYILRMYLFEWPSCQYAWMCICPYARMYICPYAHMCIHVWEECKEYPSKCACLHAKALFVCVWAYMYICVEVFMLIHVIFGWCLYADAYMHVHTSKYLFDNTCGNVYLCVLICLYVCIFVTMWMFNLSVFCLFVCKFFIFCLFVVYFTNHYLLIVCYQQCIKAKRM